MADGLKVIKLRLHDAVVIDGLAKESKLLGTSEVNVIRSILKDHFTGVPDPSNIPVGMNEEILKELHTLKVQNRILIKKLFDLSQDEYNELLKKVKQD